MFRARRPYALLKLILWHRVIVRILLLFAEIVASDFLQFFSNKNQLRYERNVSHKEDADEPNRFRTWVLFWKNQCRLKGRRRHSHSRCRQIDDRRRTVQIFFAN